MTLKLVSDREGDHIHTRVFMGPDADHLALCGTLTFRMGEWQLFCAALGLGAKQTMGHLTVLSQGEDEVVNPDDPLLDPVVKDALRDVAEERRIHRSLAETTVEERLARIEVALKALYDLHRCDPAAALRQECPFCELRRLMEKP